MAVLPVLLFLVLAGWAALVALSLWPLRRPHKIAMGFYRLVFRVTEIPQVVAALVVVTALPLLVASEVSEASEMDGAAGAVAWGLFVLVLLGVAVLIRNGVRARPAMDLGLREAGLPPTRRGRPLWRTVGDPYPRRPASVEVVSDISYGEHERHRLDLYRRADGSANGSVLVFFHGGGFASGAKDMEGRPLLHHLAERGWWCVSANYRLRPEAGLAEHLADARSAIAWARDHAAAHGADPARVVLAGSSAGAQLAAICALTPDRCGPIAGLICAYGWFPSYAEYFGEPKDPSVPDTPFELDPALAPPTLIVHGSADVITSPATAREMAARLAGSSASSIVSATLPGGQHGFDTYDSWRAQALADGVDVLFG